MGVRALPGRCGRESGSCSSLRLPTLAVGAAKSSVPPSPAARRTPSFSSAYAAGPAVHSRRWARQQPQRSLRLASEERFSYAPGKLEESARCPCGVEIPACQQSYVILERKGRNFDIVAAGFHHQYCAERALLAVMRGLPPEAADYRTTSQRLAAWFTRVLGR